MAAVVLGNGTLPTLSMACRCGLAAICALSNTEQVGHAGHGVLQEVIVREGLRLVLNALHGTRTSHAGLKEQRFALIVFISLGAAKEVHRHPEVV